MPVITGCEPPAVLNLLDKPLQVVRAFAFVDLCGFTSYTDEHGPLIAREMLGQFRARVRDVSERRGVRIAKWMGDGALLVSVETGPLVACAVDIVTSVQADGLQMRGGVSTGPALFIDGDDYVGRALNLASRLCDLAEAGCVLADGDSSHDTPSWIEAEPYKSVMVKGLGRRRDIQVLRATTGSAGAGRVI
jgi:class 3 adenylate cyclase